MASAVARARGKLRPRLRDARKDDMMVKRCIRLAEPGFGLRAKKVMWVWKGESVDGIIREESRTKGACLDLQVDYGPYCKPNKSSLWRDRSTIADDILTLDLTSLDLSYALLIACLIFLIGMLWYQKDYAASIIFPSTIREPGLVKTSAPVSVILERRTSGIRIIRDELCTYRIVSSNWALRLPSRVTAVQSLRSHP